MVDDVRAAGHVCGRERVARLMRSAALRARPKRRAKPVDGAKRQEHMISPNALDREFTAKVPNQKWVADFTYLRTHEGWLFVAVVLDLFLRRVVGWAMQNAMTSKLVTDALLMAVWRRGPAQSLMHHSDQAARIRVKTFSAC
jgi:putative transposase